MSLGFLLWLFRRAFFIHIVFIALFFILPSSISAYVFEENSSLPDCSSRPACGPDPGDCANGAKVGDGHCGGSCAAGITWMTYHTVCKNEGDPNIQDHDCVWHYIQGSANYSTGDKCISGKKGLRPGYCSGGYGSLYKTCCSGGAAVA